MKLIIKLFLFLVLFCHSVIAQKTKNQPASTQTTGKLTPIIDTSNKSLSEISVKAFGAVGDET